MSTLSGADFLRLDDLLTPAERVVRDRVRAFGEQIVRPVIDDYWERAAFPFALLPPLAALGVCGESLRDHGCPGLSHLAAGLVNAELARADGSLATFFAVQSGLVMHAIALLGSDDQRRRWLPGLARLDLIGAFALTEPAHGSDAVALETRARRDGAGYRLTGAKRWVGNATFADLTIVWARDDDGQVGGFVVERGTPGVTATLMTGKVSQRAVWQADITLADAPVPAANRLAGSHGFRDTARVLRSTRASIAWMALGYAEAAYEAALAYVLERQQFGRPLAGFQLVQATLARMLADLTGMQLLCRRLAHLAEQGQLTDGMASLAKMHCARAARHIIADARDLLGGNGILLERQVARLHADIEGLYTYEGTDSIQALIVGREITGLSAFAPR